MPSTNVRACLRRACNDIDRVRERDEISERAASRLDGVTRQLRYFVDGHDTDPEAIARPDPEAMASIQERLRETAEETEGEPAELLSSACVEMDRAVETLYDRRRRQYDVA